MRVLFVATEMAPIFKLGGLGDVIGSLPIALSQQGLEVSVVIPFYKKIDQTRFKIQKEKFKIKFKFGDRIELVELYRADYKGLEIFLVENERHIRNYEKVAIARDQAEVDHYAFFCRAVVEWLIQYPGQNYNIVHLHDWHTGLIPRLYNISCGQNGENGQLKNNVRPKFIFTIHNLGYHGFSETDLVKRLGMEGIHKIQDDPYFGFDAREDNELDLLLQGLLSADFITTVSPTYAKEIQTPQFCEGLCEILQIRSSRLVGILNGIDYTIWNPAQDSALVSRYEPNLSKSTLVEQLDSVIKSKEINKLALQKELGLPPNKNTPLIGFVGRLDSGQKGLDILYDTIQNLLEEGHFNFQFLLIGVGEEEWEQKLKRLEPKYPRQVSINIIFDDRLARKIYAGSDMMVIPSKYEPCGLVQMIAMRYGTIPVVRVTGGLKDSVDHGRTGFVFEKYAGSELRRVVQEALVCYYEQKEVWISLVKNVMTRNFSWEQSASEYAKLYKKLSEN